ncbi:hypothetical protein HYALB_00012941 [Hymenoscyphus albidus]|uniref:Rhodopsin domain-containing protein n=1 Tax=Hymenoscyphus albidus TaxID=595503 RepID=A0A9N9QAX5_9HELO|nr:hypothetical protein HYALB_00012941 [Hymenoscyphus albidus]
MGIYSPPPPLRSFHDDKATLLVCWWCTLFAAVIILFRVCGRYIRTERLFKEDWLAFACLIPLFCRMGVVHVILIFGTNNSEIADFSEHAIHRRVIGSRLVLVSRLLYAATLWMLKMTISEFFKRLVSSIWRESYERMLVFIRWFLLVTFVAVVVTDLAECQPFSHYWQVVPDPGPHCRQGYSQLLMMGSANVVTDLLLVLFPVPIIVTSKMRVTRKVQLVCLFAGSLLPAGTTLYRLPMIIDRQGSQQYRSLLASVEILFATAVANALILGSFIRDKGVKKHRWKFGSMSDSIERTTSRRGNAMRHWGSDEDLVRDLGMAVDPELREANPTPRPAPMATAGYKSSKSSDMHDWNFPTGRSEASDEIDLMKQDGMGLVDLTSPRRVSFFDVGGLLDEDRPRRISSVRTTDTDGESSMQPTWSFEAGLSPPPPPRKGSAALLHDLGGFLSPRRDRSGFIPRGFELQTMQETSREHSQCSMRNNLERQQTNISLQDVGGLLK